jgi:hypothetical protein
LSTLKVDENTDTGDHAQPVDVWNTIIAILLAKESNKSRGRANITHPSIRRPNT